MSDGALFAPGELRRRRRRSARASRRAFGPLVADDGARPARASARRATSASPAALTPARRVGIISAVTEPFCETCNRVRLTATGQLHTCLALDDDTDLRTPLRAGASDDELARKVLLAVSAKKEGHSFTACGTGGPRKHMVAIGG